MNNMLIIGGADGLTEMFIAGKLGISWLNVLGLILVERSYDATLSADSSKCVGELKAAERHRWTVSGFLFHAKTLCGLPVWAAFKSRKTPLCLMRQTRTSSGASNWIR